jgi:hypothetical protein
MLARKLLIAVLVLAFVIEVLWPVGGFFAPETLLQGFKIGVTPDVLFLVFVLAWCLLFVAIICGLALRWVLRGEPAGWSLCYVLGLWWIGIGGTLFLRYGKVENLFLDAVKGAVLTACAWASRGAQKAS